MYGSNLSGGTCFFTRGSISSKMKEETLEKCHHNICRYAVNVNRFTANVGLWDESSRHPFVYIPSY